MIRILKGALRREKVEVLPHRRLALMEQGRERVRVTIEHLGKDSVGYAVPHSELVVTKSEELETSFLLVTDGQGAPARAQLGLALLEAGAAETYLEVEGQAQRPVSAASSVDQDTSSALWPLPSAGYRVTFRLPEGETGITDGAHLAARIPWLIPTGTPRALSEFQRALAPPTRDRDAVGTTVAPRFRLALGGHGFGVRAGAGTRSIHGHE